MKKLILITTISLFSKNGFTEQKRPDYGRMAVEGMVSGTINSIKSIPKAIEIMGTQMNEPPKKAKTWTKKITCNNEGTDCKTIYSE